MPVLSALETWPSKRLGDDTGSCAAGQQLTLPCAAVRHFSALTAANIKATAHGQARQTTARVKFHGCGLVPDLGHACRVARAAWLTIVIVSWVPIVLAARADASKEEKSR